MGDYSQSARPRTVYKTFFCTSTIFVYNLQAEKRDVQGRRGEAKGGLPLRLQLRPCEVDPPPVGLTPRLCPGGKDAAEMHCHKTVAGFSFSQRRLICEAILSRPGQAKSLFGDEPEDDPVAHKSTPGAQEEWGKTLSILAKSYEMKAHFSSLR